MVNYLKCYNGAVPEQSKAIGLQRVVWYLYIIIRLYLFLNL